MAAASEAGATALADFPSSCVLVYRVLEAEGPMTVAEIRDAAYMAGRTARRAVNRLEEAVLIVGRPGLDARTTLYDVDQ